MAKSNIKKVVDSKAFVLFAITLGGSLEWYEIGIFISWPFLIQQKIENFDISLAETLNAGAIGLLVVFALANGSARALGGWFFGKKGDEQGRKIAFPLTLLIATLPSWSLGILSFFISYEYWLAYSTVLFTLVKFFQGMPAGGELPGAICYLSETANNLHKNPSWKFRRLMCSFSMLGPQIGLALSAIVCLILKAFFSIDFLITHAWRYIFIFSGLIGIGGFMMRKKLHETAAYLNLEAHHKVTHKPIKILFSKYFSRVVLASVLSVFEIVAFSILSVLPYYYSKAPFSIDGQVVLVLTFVFSGTCMILLPLIGWLSSKTISFPWFKISVWGVIIIASMFFWVLSTGQFILSIILNFILIFLMSIQAALLPSVLAEIFPVKVRYSGIAFSFNICDGVLWSAFTGICFLFFMHNNPAFVLFMPVAAIVFLVGVRMSYLNKKIYNLVK